MIKRPSWPYPLLIVLAFIVLACTPEQRQALEAAETPQLCAAQLAVGALDDGLGAVAAADAEAMADPTSPEHAAARDVLDRLDDGLRAAQVALSALPRGDHPETRQQLADVIDQLIIFVADLRSRVEAGDQAGIEGAIERAVELRTTTTSLLEAIEAEGPVGCPQPRSEASVEPTPTASSEATISAEPTQSAEPSESAEPTESTAPEPTATTVPGSTPTPTPSPTPVVPAVPTSSGGAPLLLFVLVVALAAVAGFFGYWLRDRLRSDP